MQTEQNPISIIISGSSLLGYLEFCQGIIKLSEARQLAEESKVMRAFLSSSAL